VAEYIKVCVHLYTLYYYLPEMNDWRLRDFSSMYFTEGETNSPSPPVVLSGRYTSYYFRCLINVIRPRPRPTSPHRQSPTALTITCDFIIFYRPSSTLEPTITSCNSIAFRRRISIRVHSFFDEDRLCLFVYVCTYIYLHTCVYVTCDIIYGASRIYFS
jgi:hypothetical protein